MYDSACWAAMHLWEFGYEMNDCEISVDALACELAIDGTEDLDSLERYLAIAIKAIGQAKLKTKASKPANEFERTINDLGLKLLD